MDKELPQLKHIEQVSSGWINKYILTYSLPDGRDYHYEAVSRKNFEQYRKALEANGRGDSNHPDALCLVPLVNHRQILLIKEFRYPLNSLCIAFPAGLLEPGEDLLECADRELKEETGYRIVPGQHPRPFYPLEQAGYSSTGLAEESVMVAFVDVEPDGEAHPELGEFIEPFLLDITAVPEFLKTNRLPIGTRCQLVLEVLAATLGKGIKDR